MSPHFAGSDTAFGPTRPVLLATWPSLALCWLRPVLNRKGGIFHLHGSNSVIGQPSAPPLLPWRDVTRERSRLLEVFCKKMGNFSKRKEKARIATKTKELRRCMSCVARIPIRKVALSCQSYCGQQQQFPPPNTPETPPAVLIRVSCF